MFSRLLLTTSLILLSASTFRSAALAQSVNVPFGGTVSFQTTLKTVTPGTADILVSGSSASTNTFGSVSPTMLALESNTPAIIKVSPPRFVSGPTPDPSGTIGVGFLKFGSTNVRSDVGSGTASIPIGATQLEISFRVQRPSGFMPGKYTYAVPVTITP